MGSRIGTALHTLRGSLAQSGAVKRYLRATDEPKLHLGSGDHVVEGWLNADKFSRKADLYLDAQRPFPFSDETFRCVYTEHMLEHIEVDYVPHILREAYRILQPGGLLRVTVPDLQIYVEKYVNDDQEFFQKILADYEQKRARRPDKYWLVRSKGGAFMTRAGHRFYGHQWMYDFETLEACLQEVGFREVKKQSFGQSLSEEAAALDFEWRAYETLYVDALK